MTKTLQECKRIKNYEIVEPNDLLKLLPQCDSEGKSKEPFRYIRYDYIGENFIVYEGRFEGELQHTDDLQE